MRNQVIFLALVGALAACESDLNAGPALLLGGDAAGSLDALATPDRDGDQPPPLRDAAVEPTGDAASDMGLPSQDARMPPSGDAEAPTPDAAMPADGGPPEPDPPPDPLPPDPGVNAGWIGGPCEADVDCDYAESFCLAEAEGYPRGTCSLGCERVCPDRAGMPVTFCIDEVIEGQGACVQRCDYNAFAEGCRPGYHCETRGRYAEPATRQDVCIPGPAMPQPEAGCLAELDRLGIRYARANNPLDHPDGRPDLTCDIEGPVSVSSPINGVNYLYFDQAAPRNIFASCYLAAALHELSALLQELDIVAVGHIGTYNCRLIAGTNDFSQHGLALAIDLAWFRDSAGREYNVEDHWEDDTDQPRTVEGQMLLRIAQEMFRRHIFNIILTPNYNAAHDNHFHVDLTPGARYIGRADEDHPHFGDYMGPNPHGD